MSTITIGSAEQFAALRGALEAAGYTEPEVCRRFGIESLKQYEEQFDRKQVEPFDDAPAGWLTRLFIEGEYVPETTLTQQVGREAIEAMAGLGLLERNPHNDGELAATAALYPTSGVYIVSDRWSTPDHSPFHPGADVVYPAIVSNAQRFLSLMPRSRCERMLDLCSGTAVAALTAASSFAEHAWAFDIAERSTLFAEFNRRLNSIDNVTAATGDLFEPAAGRTFDRIVAHPPYVPVLRPKWVYHDGGEDGEQIMCRIVEQLGRYLEPGGLFYMMATGSDRDRPYEQRVREWLGESQGEFDVAIFPIRLIDPEDFAARAAIGSSTGKQDVQQFKKMFAGLNVNSLVYAVHLIQRRREPRPVFTIRRQVGQNCRAEHMLSLVEWHTAMQSPEAPERILRMRIDSNPGAELRVVHHLSSDGWEPAAHVLLNSSPFSMEARTDPWAPYLIGIVDGSKTVAEYLNDLKEAGAVAPDADPAEFAQAVSILVSGGFLSVEDQ